MKTLFFTARTSVYSLRTKVLGLPGHPYRRFESKIGLDRNTPVTPAKAGVQGQAAVR